MFRHPYPIGYKASKLAFDEVYTMTISKGENGPIFTVITAERMAKTDSFHFNPVGTQVEGERSGKVFKGATPTAPWTEACKRSKSQGTRVSGPLVMYRIGLRLSLARHHNSSVAHSKYIVLRVFRCNYDEVIRGNGRI